MQVNSVISAQRQKQNMQFHLLVRTIICTKIQKNIISEIGLGMPREPKPMVNGKK